MLLTGEQDSSFFEEHGRGEEKQQGAAGKKQGSIDTF